MRRFHPANATVMLALLAACVDEPATSPATPHAPEFAAVDVPSCDDLQPTLDDPEADVITLAEGIVCQGHFDLPSRPITLQGMGSGATFDGAGTEGRVQILSGQDVGATVIRNLTFRNGVASSDGTGSGRGGAISLTGNSSPTIANNTFLGNSAAEDGGALAIEWSGESPTETIAVQDNIFGSAAAPNTAGRSGGAVSIQTLGPVQLVGNTFTRNTADEGGAFFLSGTGEVSGNTVTENSARLRGGGAVLIVPILEESIATLELHSNTWAGNSVTLTPTCGESCDAGNVGGGAIYLAEGVIKSSNSVLSANTAFEGGAFYVASRGTLEISTSGLTANSATERGGAIVNQGTLVLRSSTLSGNVAGGDGGALYLAGGSEVSNSTLSGNSATRGGALFGSLGEASLVNTTIVGNQATEAGGGVHVQERVTTKNTILAGNTTSPAGVENCAGPTPLESQGHNLTDDASCGLTLVSDQINTDPRVGPLAANGGPTKTHALLNGSPAIDAGDNVDCPTTDQRGVARPQGGACDIGSFELSALAAEIFILPGTARIPIRISDRHNVPISVTVLTTSALNAAAIAPASLTLGDERGVDTPVASYRGRPLATLIDVDRDGDRDLVAVFNKQQLIANGDLTTSTSRLVLLGALTDNRRIRGSSTVHVLP